jgi:deoxyhypusine synthase
MKVKDLLPRKQTVGELVRHMRATAFSARRLGEAVDILEQMIRDEKCTKFLGLAGALVPGGMRGCVVELIKEGWVDVIVSTGANITHDIARAFGEEYIQCEPGQVDDAKLRAKGVDRIYDLLCPARTMATMEKAVQKILKAVPDRVYASWELLEQIGKMVPDRQSIVWNAWRAGVKIIIPAFVDSILGIQTWMYSQDHKLRVDTFRDLGYLINLNFELKEAGKTTGALILGGGVPKNFIFQSVLLADKPHQYVVQIVTDRPVWGGLSGASLEEAISWGKVTEKSRLCTVHCDVTIALPVIISALKQRLGSANPSQVRSAESLHRC